MMKPFATLTGPAAPLLRPNINTDVIIRIERLTDLRPDQLGPYAFEAWRFAADGTPDPAFVLNQPAYRNAPILLAGINFGCGSSREGAVWALRAIGVRCVIAPSFGGIFYANCFQNGVLPVTLTETEIAALVARAEGGLPVTVDLQQQLVTARNTKMSFEIDPRRRESMLRGLDDIGLTLLDRDEIQVWQTSDRQSRPWIWNFSLNNERSTS